MIQQVSSRIKKILRQQQNPSNNFLFKNKSPSVDHSISSNHSHYNNQSAKVSSTQEALKNLFPPPKSRQSSKLLENKQMHQIKPRTKTSVSNQGISSEIKQYQNQLGEYGSNFEFMGTFNEKDLQSKRYENTNVQNHMKSPQSKQQNEIDKLIIQQLIQENNQKFVIPAIQELSEKIDEIILSKIYTIIPKIMPNYAKQQFQTHISKNNHYLISSEPILSDTPLQHQKVDYSPGYSIGSQDVFTPKIQKYTESIQSVNLQTEMHEQIILQREIINKTHSFMSSLTAKVNQLQRQMIQIREYFISNKNRVHSNKNYSDNITQKRLQNLTKKLQKIQEQLTNQQHKQNTKIDKDQISQEMIKKIQKRILKPLIKQVSSTRQCACQAVVDEILKTQKHLMDQLKYIKYFAKQNTPNKDKSTARFGNLNQSKSRKKLKQNQNQQQSVIRKLRLYCKSD